MLSLFGIISLVVLVMCITILIIHTRVLNSRNALDVAFALFDELLRTRLELIIEIAPQDLQDICDQYTMAQTQQIIKSWQKIKKATNVIKEELEKNEALTANAEEISIAVKAYEECVLKYNRQISSFPGKIVALLVGFKAEGLIHIVV